MDTKTLAGKYDREGSRLRGERELLIVTRPAKERTRAKAEEYLLEVKPNGSRDYVSSLWKTNEEGVYRIEHNRDLHPRRVIPMYIIRNYGHSMSGVQPPRDTSTPSFLFPNHRVRAGVARPESPFPIRIPFGFDTFDT
jgi:hypothetical protein